MNESKVRDQIVDYGRSIYERGLTHGSSGNISVKVEDKWIVTPTNCCLGRLEPDSLSLLDQSGNLVSGSPPTKEAFLHFIMYRSQPKANAIVHLHSTHSVAVSCLDHPEPENVLPPITAYHVMKVGRLPLVPYYPPGDPELAQAVGKVASTHHAVLLANHGPVVAGTSLEDAVNITEELEQTAKLSLFLKGRAYQNLNEKQVSELESRFGSGV